MKLNSFSGYIGEERSVRSQNAIDDFEVPISHINKELINQFLYENKENYSLEEIDILKNTSAIKWKFISSELINYDSYHHTGKYYTVTKHYSLYSISDKILEMKDDLDKVYKEFLENKKINDNTRVTYCYIKLNVWGGTRKHPRIIGEEEKVGIYKNGWVYHKTGKNKVDSNRVITVDYFDSYKDLVKKYPSYKGTVKIFNNLIKECFDKNHKKKSKVKKKTNDLRTYLKEYNKLLKEQSSIKDKLNNFKPKEIKGKEKELER